ncbi:AT-rich interactive domain-containing protein 5B [Nymphon striatum]|nr:AT-rich interactive domain-containing protein 5B [Nymphon striatum]
MVSTPESYLTPSRTSGDVDDCPCSIKIISYPQYYRHRALEKQLENANPTVWHNTAVIKALGGITVEKGKKVHIMFCRDVFYHPALFENEKCCNYLAPSLKGRPRKKRRNHKRSTSPGSESNDSVESKSSVVNLRAKRIYVNGVKQPKLNLEYATPKEREFYADLFSFMNERNTPIGRIPSLGFKLIDLCYFYKRVQQLGGYNRVSEKRLWKQMFEEVTGSTSSTSAATTTRKHYERLLLPYECRAKKLNVKRKHHTQLLSPKCREIKIKEVRKVESDSEGDETKNGSISGQDSEHDTTGGGGGDDGGSGSGGDSTPPQVEDPVKETNSPSNNENKRIRTDSPEEHPANKKVKEDLQIDKEKKWDEIRKKNTMSRVRATSVSNTAQTFKKSLITSAIQKKQENCKIEPVNENLPGVQKSEEELMRLPENSALRPSVIQHAPLPMDSLICDMNSETRHSNGGPAPNKFSRLQNHNSLISPSLNSHIPKSSSPSSLSKPSKNLDPPPAHQSSVFKSSIDSIKKSIQPYSSSDQRSLITNQNSAHQASTPTSSYVYRPVFGKEILDLSKKQPANSLPIRHTRADAAQSNIHMNMPIVNTSIDKKPPQSSPLMSLTSMSAKLNEKIRTSKTVKVPPMINTSSLSKSISNSSSKPKPEILKPVSSVTPQMVDRPSNSSKPNSVVHPVQSFAMSNNNSTLVDPATTNGHYSLPHYATSFPFIIPPNHAFPSGQYPPPYFPHPMFGLSYPGMMMSDNMTNPYRELMHRGLLPGQCQTSMYPGFPTLDSVSAQMYNASQHLLRPNNFPSSKSANRP